MAEGLKGLADVIAAMKRIDQRVDRAIGAGLFVAGNIIMTDAKERVPVDTGSLRASGYVTLPRKEAGDIVVEAGFGGPSAEYAVPVHERTEVRHEVGEAKYFERAVQAKMQQAAEMAAQETERVLLGGKQPTSGSNPTIPEGG